MTGKVRYKNRWMTHDEVRKLRDEESKVDSSTTDVLTTDIPSLSSITEDKIEKVEQLLSKSLEEIREEFKAKFGQSVSNRYKNDTEWIIQKLNS